MKNIFLLVITFFFLSVFYSCDNNNKLEQIEGKKHIILDDIQKASWNKILKFAEKVNGSSSRGISDFSDIKITNVEKETIKVDHLKRLLNRSSDSINMNVETYRFTMEKNGKIGFAITTSDERCDRILAFVEEGSLADTATVPGMAYMIRRFKDVLAEDLDRYYTDKPQTYAEFWQEWTLRPCLKTQWHRAEPYNNNYESPSSPCQATENGKYQASSTAISIAQCVANYPTDYDIPRVLLQKHNIAELTAQSKIYPTDLQLAPKVAAFVKEFDPDKKAKFKCSGSSTEIADVIPVLNALGFTGNYYYGMNRHDIIRVFKSLRWECPTVYGGMRRDFSQFESWVIDGFWGMVNNTVTKIELNSVHCVFAFGGRGNGWYSNPSEPVDQNGKPVYDSGQYYHKTSLQFRPVCPWCVE